MVLAEFGTGQVLYSMFYLFLFMIWFWLLIVIFGDIFRSTDLSGWGKAGWSFFVIVAPYLGIFVYLIARGHGMSDRAIAQQQAQQQAFNSYAQQTGGVGSADQIARAKQLLDDGAITQDEFNQMKAKALA